MAMRPSHTIPFSASSPQHGTTASVSQGDLTSPLPPTSGNSSLNLSLNESMTARTMRSFDADEMDGEVTALRILLPGNVVQLEHSGYLTLRVPVSKAAVTTIGRLKKQALTSLARKILRKEIPGPGGIVHSPEELSKLYAPSRFALVRLSRTAADATSDALDEKQLMTAQEEWQTMALMLMRVESEAEFLAAQRAALEETAEHRHEEQRRFQLMQQQQLEQKQQQLRRPPYLDTSDSSSFYSPIKPAVRADQLLSPTSFGPNHTFSPTSLGSPSYTVAPDGTLPTLQQLSAGFARAAAHAMKATMPLLAATALDVCICLHSGAYVCTSLTLPPRVMIGPVGPSSNWSCFDGLLPSLDPNASANSTPTAAAATAKKKKGQKLKFLQNTHTKEWLCWKLVDPARGRVEIGLSATLTPNCRWIIVKGAQQFLEAPAFGNADGRKAYLTCHPQTKTLMAYTLSLQSGEKPRLPLEAQTQICFAMTQGKVERRREGWALWEKEQGGGAEQENRGTMKEPSRASAQAALSSWLPRFAVLTGTTISYWNLPDELTHTTDGREIDLTSAAMERVKQIEDYTATAQPLLVVQLVNLKGLTVLKSEDPATSSDDDYSSTKRHVMRIEYMDATSRLQVLDLSLSSPSSSPFLVLDTWLLAFRRRGIVPMWARRQEGRDAAARRAGMLMERGVPLDSIHASSAPAMSPPSDSNDPSSSTEQFDQDEEAYAIRAEGERRYVEPITEKMIEEREAKEKREREEEERRLREIEEKAQAEAAAAVAAAAAAKAAAAAAAKEEESKVNDDTSSMSPNGTHRLEVTVLSPSSKHRTMTSDEKEGASAGPDAYTYASVHATPRTMMAIDAAAAAAGGAPAKDSNYIYSSRTSAPTSPHHGRGPSEDAAAAKASARAFIYSPLMSERDPNGGTSTVRSDGSTSIDKNAHSTLNVPGKQQFRLSQTGEREALSPNSLRDETAAGHFSSSGASRTLSPTRSGRSAGLSPARSGIDAVAAAAGVPHYGYLDGSDPHSEYVNAAAALDALGTSRMPADEMDASEAWRKNHEILTSIEHYVAKQSASKAAGEYDLAAGKSSFSSSAPQEDSLHFASLSRLAARRAEESSLDRMDHASSLALAESRWRDREAERRRKQEEQWEARKKIDGLRRMELEIPERDGPGSAVALGVPAQRWIDDNGEAILQRALSPQRGRVGPGNQGTSPARRSGGGSGGHLFSPSSGSTRPAAEYFDDDEYADFIFDHVAKHGTVGRTLDAISPLGSRLNREGAFSYTTGSNEQLYSPAGDPSAVDFRDRLSPLNIGSPANRSKGKGAALAMSDIHSPSSSSSYLGGLHSGVRPPAEDEWSYVRHAAEDLHASQLATRKFILQAAERVKGSKESMWRSEVKPSREERRRILEVCLATSSSHEDQTRPQYINATSTRRPPLSPLVVGELSPASNWVLSDVDAWSLGDDFDASILNGALKCLRHSTLTGPSGEDLFLACDKNGMIVLMSEAMLVVQRAQCGAPAPLHYWVVHSILVGSSNTVPTPSASTAAGSSHQQFQSLAFPSKFLSTTPLTPGSRSLLLSTAPPDVLESASVDLLARQGGSSNPETQWRICFAVVQGVLKKKSSKSAAAASPLAGSNFTHSTLTSPVLVWAPRFFVLSGLTLCYFARPLDAQSGAKPTGVYPLHEIKHVRSEVVNEDEEHMKLDGKPCGIVLQLYSGKSVHLLAENPFDCQSWLAALQRKGIPNLSVENQRVVAMDRMFQPGPTSALATAAAAAGLGASSALAHAAAAATASQDQRRADADRNRILQKVGPLTISDAKSLAPPETAQQRSNVPLTLTISDAAVLAPPQVMQQRTNVPLPAAPISPTHAPASPSNSPTGSDPRDAQHPLVTVATRKEIFEPRHYLAESPDASPASTGRIDATQTGLSLFSTAGVRSVLHVCIQSEFHLHAPPSPSITSRGGVSVSTIAGTHFLTSHDLIHHPSALPGVSLLQELTEFATWTCADTVEVQGQGQERETMKVFRDYRGQYLNCTHAGALAFSPIATHESHWRLHKRRAWQLLESASHQGFFLAADTDGGGRPTVFDARAMLPSGSPLSPGPNGSTSISFTLSPTSSPSHAAAAPSISSTLSPTSRTSRTSRVEDSHPELRWKLCFAVIQGELLKRGEVLSPRVPGQTVDDSAASSPHSGEKSTVGRFVPRHFWASPTGLSYWRSAADVHPHPAVRTYPYHEILAVLVAPSTPARFDLLLTSNERVELQAASSWQKDVWVQALANKGVRVEQLNQMLKA